MNKKINTDPMFNKDFQIEIPEGVVNYTGMTSKRYKNIVKTKCINEKFIADISPLYITRVTEDKYFILRGTLPVKNINTESMEVHEDALEVTNISGFEIAIGQTIKFLGAYPTKVLLGKEDTPNICNNFEEMVVMYDLIKDEE